MTSGNRPITTPRFAWLKEESEYWLQQELLTPEEQTRILGCYEPQDVRQHRSQQYGILALAALGMFLFGLSALLLVGHNWKYFSPDTKLGILFGAMIVTYLVAFFFSRLKQVFLSEVVFFFGAILYCIGVWQVAQIYHVVAYFPDGTWLCAMGVFVLAMGLRTPLCHFLAVGLLCVWCTQEMCMFRHLGPGFLRDVLPWLPNIAISLPIFVLLGEWWGRKRGYFSVRWLYMAALMYWLFLQPIAWNTSGGGPFYFAFLGTMLLLIPSFAPLLLKKPESPADAVTEGGREFTLTGKTDARLATFCRIVGVLCIGGGMILPSLQYYWESVIFNSYGYDLFFTERDATLITILNAVCVLTEVAVVTGLCLWAAQNPEVRRRLRQETPLIVLSAIMLVFWCGVTLYKTSELGQLFLETLGVSELAYWPVNLLMILFALMFIYRGVRTDAPGVFTFGVLYFILWSIIRYVVLVGNSMLQASGVFAFCAVVLILVSLWWKYRKFY